MRRKNTWVWLRAFLLVLLLLVLLILWVRPRMDRPRGVVPDVTLWIEPHAGKEPILQAFDSAQHDVRMAFYSITDPDVIQKIKDTVARGVTVRLMLENNPYGGSSTNIDIGLDLQQAGVQLKWAPRAYRYLHEKAIVVDGQTAYVMTHNLTTSAFTANREYGVSFTDPVFAGEIARVFDADWDREPVDLSNALLIWSPDNSRERFTALFRRARESIWLEHQNLQDPEMVDALCQAAQRGVDVRLISTPRWPIENDFDEPGREQLRRAGGQVRYILDPYIHAKVFVVDGRWGVVGSVNLTTNSLDNNRELAVLFDDADAVRQMLDQFEADWAQGTVEPFPKEKLPIPPEGYIDHTQARLYLFRDDVPVQLTVTHTYNSGRVIWLMGNADVDRNFKVVIFPSAYSKFPGYPDVLPDEYYKGKTIRVRGLIKLYRGWPEIIVNSPSQIEVVK
ncbi:MAG: hypothetical protein GXO55_10540 [Chloroflexi bacterium]|nr:hypothetical protein [Chloroflexota bacterium]